MKIDILTILAAFAVLIGLGLEAICIYGLITQGLISGDGKQIVRWTIASVAFIPAIVCLFKLFFSTLGSD